VELATIIDYTNGFHDAANAIATSISTRALTPRVALLLAAVMNFVGAFLGTKVAKTVFSVLEPPSGEHALVVIFAALGGAITWNLITWALGLPSSSSHALIGGLVGAGMAGGVAVQWDSVVDKVVIPMLVSPVVGGLLAFVLMLAILWLFKDKKPGPTNRGFRMAQTVSASAMALGHGLQDAQKTMGVIVDPPRGFAAETAASSILYTTAYVFEAPISTTQTITGAIMGAGASKGRKAVRWGVAGNILAAWVLTIPMAALVAAGVYGVVHLVLE
jgi:PiT family inorganic phosphate transporter